MSREISSEFAFDSHFIEIDGSDIHYADVGEGDHYVREHHPHRISEEIASGYTNL